MDHALLLFLFSLPLLKALPQEPIGVLYKKENIPYKLEVFPAPEGVPYEKQGSPQLVEINQAPWPSEELGSPFELFNQASKQNPDVRYKVHKVHSYEGDNAPLNARSEDVKEAHDVHPYKGVDALPNARSEDIKGREVRKIKQ